MVKKKRILLFGKKGKRRPLFKKGGEAFKRQPQKRRRKVDNNYKMKYNIYYYDPKGLAKKVKVLGDKKEAETWVANRKAMSPNSVYKIVPEAQRKGWW